MDTPFFGGSSEGWSSNLSNSRCMNLYPELVETKDGKQVGGFYSTPGLKQWATVANGGKGIVRGLHYVSATNLLLVVCGNTLTSITQNGVQTVLGTIKSVVGAVSIIDNGTQYFLSDGVNAYVYASGALTVINTLPPNPGITTYQDNLGLVAIRGTNQFYQSNIGDLSTWDALSFSSADSEPSPIMAIISLFRQVWVFKQQSVEIWNNAGLNGFAFQRMEGAYLEIGCISPYSVCQVGDRLIWLGQDDQGQGVIYMTNGYSGHRISTHPVEYAMRSYGKISDAVAYSYQQAGHLFYVISFPTGNATWVYDRTTGLWHERGEYINGDYAMHDSSRHALFAGLNIVGSASSTTLYSMDMSYAQDDLTPAPPSNPKRWVRRWRALQKPMNAPVRLQSLRIDMQTGVQLSSNSSSLGIVGALGNGRSGLPANMQYSLINGISPATYAIVSGSLPAGLSMSTLGLVTGTRGAVGSYTWIVESIDQFGNAVSKADTSQTTAPYAWTWVAQTQLPTTQSRIAPPYADPSSGLMVSSDDATGGLYLSSDGGKTWNRVATGMSAGDNVICAGASQGALLAFSEASAKTARSIDNGNHWTILTNSNIAVQNAIYSPTCVFVYGFSGGASYSTDGGQTWTVPSTPSGFNVGDSSIAFGGLYIPSWNTWIAPGQGAIYEATGTGINNVPSSWTTALSGTQRVGITAYSPSLDVAVIGSTSGIYYRTKTGSWTYVTFSGSSVNGVCWCPTLSLFVAVGSGTWISSDGIHWTSVTDRPNGGFLMWSPVANQMFLTNSLASGLPPYLSNI